jgi:hypothetical protein
MSNEKIEKNYEETYNKPDAACKRAFAYFLHQANR